MPERITGAVPYAALAIIVLIHADPARARDTTGDIDIVFPDSANVFDVVEHGGVDNSGRTDVTAKLGAILRERARPVSVVYLPAGTYLVSGELYVKINRNRKGGSHSHGPWIMGESRTGTVIRLKDGTWPTPVYDLTESKKRGGYPKRLDRQVVLSTGDATNSTFNKLIRNLTVNTGKNNAGAIGVQYCTSNTGFLGEVDVISEEGEEGAGLAIENGGRLYLRDVRSSGYEGVLEEEKTDVEEYYSGDAKALFRDRKASLRLPIRKSPLVPYEKDMSKWANPVDYGAKGDGSDDTEAVQAALSDETKTHVVFPYSSKPHKQSDRHKVPDKIGRRFKVTKPLLLGPTVERVVGTPGTISSSFPDKATLTIGDGEPDVVVIEGMTINCPIIIDTDRTVVITRCRPGYAFHTLGDVRGYDASTAIVMKGTGDVFLNDTSQAFLVEDPRQKVWVRHYNDESGWWLRMPAVNVFAGQTWILGYKSEAFNRRALVRRGGRLELIGFNSYSQSRKKRRPEEDVAIFSNQGGDVSFINLVQRGSRKYSKLVEETFGGETKILSSADNGGHDIGLYTSFGGR